MAESPDKVVPVRLPQINVNDEEVTLVGWRVADGEPIAQGEPMCEVETSKSVDEVPAPAGGVLRHAAIDGAVIQVGQVIGYIGPSVEAVAAYCDQPDRHQPLEPSKQDAPTRDSSASSETPTPTAGAIALARRFGLDPAGIQASGPRLQRADVERYLAEHPDLKHQEAAAAGPQVLPPGLVEFVDQQVPLGDHDWAIAQHLQRTQASVISAQAAMDAEMTGGLQWIARQREAGVMTGPLPLFLKAVATAIAANEKLAAFRVGREVYRYRNIDLAYTARSADQRLFTPVVRNVPGLTLDDLAGECNRLNMAVFRGELSAAEQAPACMTVSILSDHPVRYHIGLQNTYQSAVLTIGAIREEPRLVSGELQAVSLVTMVLTYDHGLMDGWEAAACLDAARRELESLDS